MKTETTLSRPVRIVVIGAGNRAHKYLEYARRNPEQLRLAAIVEVNDLRRRIVPIWLYHRYQVDAAAKLIGGIDYGYPVAGAGHEAATPVAAADQRRALDALIEDFNKEVRS